MVKRSVLFCCAIVALVGGILRAQAQELQISPNNRTVCVTAEDEVTLEPDIAIVNFGYQTFGPDQQAAMNDLSQKSRQISKALADAGVDPKSVETSSLDVNRNTYFDPQTPLEVRKQREFVARENWRVRVKAADASKITGISRSGGANTFQNIQWELADPNEAYVKANAAAIRRARTLAEKMASDMGVKLGKLLYLSNANPVGSPMAQSERIPYAMKAAPSPAELEFNVSRQLIRRSATVYVVYGVE